MKHAPSYIAGLLLRHFTDELTPEEKVILDEWIAASEENRQLMKELEDPEQFMRDWESYNRYDSESAWIDLQRQAPELFPGNERRRKRLAWMSRMFGSPAELVAGVVVLFLVVFTLIRYLSSSQDRVPVAMNRPQTPIQVSPTPPPAPAGAGASLEFPGGPVLELAGLRSGIVGSAGGLAISKTADAQITLKAVGHGGGPSGDKGAWVLKTHRKARYTAVLPDGTVVKLNARSTLWIPVGFGKSTRDVTLEGEAYFDVAHSPGGRTAMSFVVHVVRRPTLARHGAAGSDSALKIVSLGTRFDVKAYADEAHVSAILDQGAIRLENGEEKLVLRKGESAIVDSSGAFKMDSRHTLDSSWKDGIFSFSEASATEILRDVGRWYGVGIKCSNTPPADAKTFHGPLTAPLDSTFSRLAKIVPFEYHILADTVYVSY